MLRGFLAAFRFVSGKTLVVSNVYLSNQTGGRLKVRKIMDSDYLMKAKSKLENVKICVSVTLLPYRKNVQVNYLMYLFHIFLPSHLPWLLITRKRRRRIDL